jgi:hypothetical protein
VHGIGIEAFLGFELGDQGGEVPEHLVGMLFFLHIIFSKDGGKENSALSLAENAEIM